MVQRDEAFRYAVDERLVVPESRFEAVDGQVVHVSPADREYASCHSKLAALLEACAAEGYDVAVDMLTRTSETSDLAPDVSVYPIAPDPNTGGRQLEELAFEVVSTETLSHAQTKARALRQRGVRRVFAIDAERRRVLELSDATGSFEILDSTRTIVDPVLTSPLELSALFDRAKVDNAILQALLRKKNAVIEAALAEREARGEAIGRVLGRAEGEVLGRAEGEALGRAEGEALGRAKGEASGRVEGEALGRAEGEALGRLSAKREVLLNLLQARGLELSAAARERVESTTDESLLERWLIELARSQTVDDLLDD